MSRLADALRRMRADAAPVEGWRQAPGALTWAVRGRTVATIGYHVAERAEGRRCCVLRYTAGGRPVEDVIDLAERPSNLGRGQIMYWRCPCGQLARVLYFDNANHRWRCRRCCPVVYASSRSSDRRLSAILAGTATLARADWGGAIDGALLATLGAARLAQQLRANDADLFLALKALDRLGLGLGLTHAGATRRARWHGSTGRARPRGRTGAT
ncbi:MAG: hypothetical protein WCI67_24245 [Chloroflexales bacterium]